MKLRVANIDDHLDMVLPLLSELCKRDNPDWVVEDAVESCRIGHWMLVIGEEPGFAMFSLRQHRFTQEQILFVEVMCHPNSDKKIEYFQPFMDVLAHNMNCDLIQMASRRRGWEKLGWQGGWIQ